MDTIQAIFDFITGFGASAMMPIIITILGVALGAKFGKALRSGVIVGIGFIGINLITSLIFQYVGPAAQAMATNWGLSLNVVDVGWAVASAITWSTEVGSAILVVGLLVNIIMLATGLTKTLDVDLWNYWNLALTGSVIALLTGSFWIGVAASAIHAALTFWFADATAPTIQKYFNWPDLSISHGWQAGVFLIVWPMMKLFDLLGLEKDAAPADESDMVKLQEKLGFFGEPVLIALVLGLVIGLLAYAPAAEMTLGEKLTAMLTLAMTMAGIMLLLPRMVGILMEGLVTVSEQAREFLQKRFQGRQFYIGMDSALMIGDPLVLTVSFMLVPITLVLAVILPGNHMLPFGDLASIPFLIALAAPFSGGRFWRTFLTGLVIVVVLIYMSSIWAPIVTDLAQSVGYSFPEGATEISFLSTNPGTWPIFMIVNALVGG